MFHATIANKTTIEEGRMRVEQEGINFLRWYQQLEDTQQQDDLMMEGLQKEVQNLQEVQVKFIKVQTEVNYRT